jgi:hypothetical protein
MEHFSSHKFPRSKGDDFNFKIALSARLRNLAALSFAPLAEGAYRMFLSGPKSIIKKQNGIFIGVVLAFT